MDLLERVWEGTTALVNGTLEGFSRGVTSLFGSSNARHIKRYEAIVQKINLLEDGLTKLTDDQLRAKTEEFKQRLHDGQTLDDILIESFAVCREGGRRFLKMRHYDVQLIGGIVLHNGMIAEMVTGEGKTLVATLPTYLNALAGRGCHVVTVNDYLARRDMEWMAPLYMGLGLTVGAIQGGLDNDQRQAAYAKDITYATNNELGFDYLRDNMRLAARNDNRFPKYLQQVQGPLAYAIIDEVDNILIDEARTPLIISGPAHMDVGKYADADRIARQLQKESHFVVNEKDHTVNLTDEGVRVAEKLAGVESFYTAGNMEWPHLIDNSLKAHHLYKVDVSYVVKEGSIIIVDDFTGRLMEGRQWSDGLHQAVEAKEGVRIKEETQTLATITFQNFFKLYEKIAGMTGTAMTEANEFWKIYNLDVIAIPTNRNLSRIESPDVIYLTEKEKFGAVADEVERAAKYDIVFTKDGQEHKGQIVRESDSELTLKTVDREEVQIARSEATEINKRGRPILIGTVSIEKSEQISKLLERRGIEHQVLNAKNHGREAEIVAQAGRLGAVTIATNMAGRGTDIILGGNPETMAWAQLQSKYPTRLDVPREEWDSLVHEIEQREKMKEAGEQVRGIGGLYVIGTERHESRRIDLQLRGRSGRQGDPGGSRFFLSLEDDLMRIFAGDFVRNMMGRLGMGEGEPIESSFVSRRITAAQKKVEERNFEIRKNLLEYDEVMDQQRKRIYSYRQQILDGVSCRHMVLDQIHQQIEHYVKMYTDPTFGADSYSRWASKLLSCELDARDFRNLDPGTASVVAIDSAERAAETQILDAIEENLPEEEPQEDWNWGALAKWVNTRYGTNYSTNDLKRIPRDEIDEKLIQRVHERLGAIDLSEGASFLHSDYGLKMLADWMKIKFGIELDIDELRQREPADITDELTKTAEAAYRRKEAQFPVLAGLTRFGRRTSETSVEINQPALLAWAQHRFDPNISEGDLFANSSMHELSNKLLEYSLASCDESEKASDEAHAQVRELFGGAEPNTSVKYAAGSNGVVDSFRSWLDQRLSYQVEGDELADLDETQVSRRVTQAVDDRYHPEIRRMERQVLLQIVDSAWKDHLLAMDHLRSAISLKGYAQMDPKVEFKREGMRMYGDMWFSIGERMTDLIFRMEALDEGFIASTMPETTARHDSLPPPTQDNTTREQRENLAAADRAGKDTSARPEPIRNTGDRVGRNDPCPCGSGKKFKACHGRR